MHTEILRQFMFWCMIINSAIYLVTAIALLSRLKTLYGNCRNLGIIGNMFESKYTIDLEKDIIYCKYVGTIIAEDLIQHIIPIRKDPKFISKLNTIADLREATFADSTRDMIKMSEFSHASSAARGPFKLALITSRSSSQNIELYTALTDIGHAEMFHSMSDAENWICST